jgi:uncharacterized membrane protein YfcA
LEAWELALVVGGSFAAGFLGSAVGLVLGTLRLPVVLVAAGSPAAAAGTNIAVSATAALVGGVTHARAGRVDWSLVRWMTPPSVGAAFVGGYFAHLLPRGLLLALIAAILFWSGFDLLLDLRAEAGTARRPRATAAAAGAAIGLLGGAVGLILGTLRLPALIRGAGLPAHRAVGTNLVVGFFLGVFGFLGHLLQAEVEWAVLGVSLVGAIPGSWLGARVTGKLSEHALRRAIGLVLLAVAVAIAVSAAR